MSYQWDFDGDGTVDQTTPTATVTHLYNTPGSYNAKVTTVDNGGASTTSTPAIITVSPGPLLPITAMLPTGGPLTGTQDVTSITAGYMFDSLIGCRSTRDVEVDVPVFAAPDTLVGLDLSTAMLGLPTSGFRHLRVLRSSHRRRRHRQARNLRDGLGGLDGQLHRRTTDQRPG